ncbi:putative Zinc finger-XS domain-containing protein [Rosa chinensis]|uniref:Putative Zinc finger-XS domain-containing protein n=1 Tax=Rosa chinensis TaxID=74649 RepID=A0A2P6RVI1_ROSCH|nr:putative Zinc finger-XS domain-containing protein [Rosa chinensis]
MHVHVECGFEFVVVEAFVTIQMDAMDYSSDEESDNNESEISDYKDKPYEQLRSGKLKVKGPNGTLRCPFCARKKKQDYKHKDLLQHASGVAKGSANRSTVQKANHKARIRDFGLVSLIESEKGYDTVGYGMEMCVSHADT